MKTFTLLALAAAARLAQAHSTVFAIFVNDVDQGLGNSASGYIRSPPNNNPITDVTSSSMTCNVNNVATAKTIKVVGGDKVSLLRNSESHQMLMPLDHLRMASQ
jgi:cellulase